MKDNRITLIPPVLVDDEDIDLIDDDDLMNDDDLLDDIESGDLLYSTPEEPRRMTSSELAKKVVLRGRGRPKLSPEERDRRQQERAQRVVERDPEIVCIRINPAKFHLEETEQSIYERTRGAWRTGMRAMTAKYVLAAITGKYGGLITNKIVAIYDVEKWQSVNPAGYTTRAASEFADCENRVEFIGAPTQNPQLQALIGKIFHPAEKLNGSNPISFRKLENFEVSLMDIPKEESEK